MNSLLKQKKILVTREKTQAHAFSQQIIANDGRPIEVPLLDIKCQLKDASQSRLGNGSKFDWIFFTSANGVHCFFKQIHLLGVTHQVLQKQKFAVVGHKTEQALQAYGFRAHFVPQTYNAKTMADQFVKTYPVPEDILLIQGSRSLPVLHDQLLAHERSVHCLSIYETVIRKESKQLLNEHMQNSIDFITFTSPSTVDAFVNLLDEPISKDVVFVCIGTTTEKRVHEKGIQQTLTPERFTIEDMIAKMGQYLAKKG